MTEALSIDRLPRQRAVAAILGAGLLLTLLCVLCAGDFGLLSCVSNWYGPRHWIPTPCRIVQFRVAAEPVFSDEITRFPMVKLEYRYEIAGHMYESGRYAFSSDSAELQNVEIFQPGPATCYVDPADPGSAVLVRGFNARIGRFLILAGCILAGTIAAAIARLRKE